VTLVLVIAWRRADHLLHTRKRVAYSSVARTSVRLWEVAS
jgi:hypothetical protein